MMVRFVFLFLLFVGACRAPVLTTSDIVGLYHYKNGAAEMVLKINDDGGCSWSISEKKRVINAQDCKWQAYDLNGNDQRLLIKDFCFPPGVSRAGRCTDEYPAILETDYIYGNISIPLDVDYSKSALIKKP